MALIVEDGSIVAGANSYVSLADARTYLLTRGLQLSGVDATDEALLLNAVDYIEGYADKFKGSKVSADQELQWPRKNVSIDGFDFPEDDMPVELWRAQSILAYESHKGNDLFPSSTGKRIARERVDVLEVEYDGGSSEAPSPIFRRVDTLLKPLIVGGGRITVERA